ncbi:MAG: BACON domain-containing protein, partial [Synergistaceae bacterium]|nr:BACON domain-containing protein [Synergistaceae bacterium]
NTKTFSTRDVEPSLTNLNNNGSELKWTYDFLAPQQNRSAGKWQRLYDGAVLGHSAFTPTNMWIWSVPTSKRNAYNSFNVTFVPTAESKLTRNSGSISPRTITVTGHGTTLSVNLPKPPLLAIEADTVSFGNAAESKTVRIGSQGGWSANVTSGSDWLSVTQNGKQLYVTVKGNTGSSARKGTINVTRNNTTDKGVIAVTQLTTPLSR